MTENVFAIAMVKNEDDILHHVLNHLLTQDVDHFIVADNMSNDNTLLILDSFDERYPGKFTILEDREPGYYQAQKMNSLMAAAVDQGADIILPFDADEIFLAHDKNKTVGQVLRESPHPVQVAEVWDMVGVPKTYNVLVDMCWREPVIKSLPSVAFRWEPGSQILQGNHGVTHSGTKDCDSLWVRHYQYRSLSQFKQKVRQGKQAYDATTLPIGEGYHWRIKGAMSDEQIEQEWNNILNQPGLIYDPFKDKL